MHALLGSGTRNVYLPLKDETAYIKPGFLYKFAFVSVITIGSLSICNFM